MTKVAIVICIIAPLYNTLAVLVLSCSESGSSADMIWHKLITNPLIIATLLGIGGSLLKLQLPRIIYMPVSSLADLAMPLALLTLGGSIHFNKGDNNIRLAMIASVLKRLLIH